MESAFFPELETREVCLREILSSDAPALFRLRSNEKVMRYTDRPLAKAVEESMEMIRNMKAGYQQQTSVTWGISARGNSQMAGTIGYWRINRESKYAEIGFLLDPQFWGRGLMKAALPEVLRFGFREMQMERIIAAVHPENTASLALMQRFGFVLDTAAYFDLPCPPYLTYRLKKETALF